MNGMRRGFRGAAVAWAVLVAPTAPALAQDFSLVTTLVHPNSRPNNEDRFGSGVAISGGTLFVGAKSEQAANGYSGVVHVFSDTDWSEVARLESSIDADTEFGAAIQVDGDRALISNMAIDNGVVWFFEKVAGVWTEKLRVQGLVNEAFGYRLALRGDFAFIAAPRVGTGNVRVYRRVAGTWGEVQVLTANDALAEDFFGYSIAFDGDRLAVAAPGSLLGAERSSVYTFSRSGDAFVQEGKLAGADPAKNWFGSEVGMSGGTLIVNAPAAYQMTSEGKALVYERRAEQWELTGELTVAGEASFPSGLAVDRDTAWLGARTSEPRSENVYAFSRTSSGWQEAQKLSFPVLGEYEIASWASQDGTFAIGFWNGLRTESVQVYRGAGYDGSTGGAAAGAGAGSLGGANAAGAARAGGASGEHTASAGGGSKSSSGGAAGHGAASESSQRGGCAIAPARDAPGWPLALLALVTTLTRKRRTRRAA